MLRFATLVLAIIVLASTGLVAGAQSNVKAKPPRHTIHNKTKKHQARNRSKKSKTSETVATTRAPRETIQ